jgi:tetratricopeptide (TPR) repeat protein
MTCSLGVTALAMVIHVIRLGVNVSAADRYLYVPVAAIAIGLAPLVERAWQKRRPITPLVTALMLGSFAVATTFQAQKWVNELTLWRAEVTHSSGDNPLPRIELAVALMHRSRFDEALADLDQVSMQDLPSVELNRAVCLDKIGRRDEAIAQLEEQVRLNPDRPRVRINLMMVHARAGHFDKALALGQKLVAELNGRLDIEQLVALVKTSEAEWAALPPDTTQGSVAIRASWAGLYERLGALPEAEAHWRSIALDPQSEKDMRLRGAAYLVLFGDAKDARGVLGTLANDHVLATEMPALHASLDARFDDE